MQNIKIKTLALVNVNALASFVVLSGMAMFLPFFIHVQWITGPIINAIFILTLFLCGVRSALLLCLVPSLMALSGGLLPIVLAPAVPFIMISNAFYVLSIDWLYSKSKNITSGYWLGVLAGSLAKFLFLIVSLNLIARLAIKQDVVAIIIKMFSWPQFATAMIGGMIAWVVLKGMKRI